MKESKGGRRRDRALLLPDTQHEPLSDKDSDMNFLTLPNQNLSSNILRGGFFAQADLPAPLAGAFVGFDDATDALINVALSSVFHTAPESDEFALDLDRDDFQIGDRFDIAVRVFDEDGSLQNFGSTDLTIFVDEFMNDGTILFGITTRDLSHDRVNPSEVARLENEAVDAYLNGETDEVPACLVEEAPEAPVVEEAPEAPISELKKRAFVVEVDGQIIAVRETARGDYGVAMGFKLPKGWRVNSFHANSDLAVSYYGKHLQSGPTHAILPTREIFTKADLKGAKASAKAYQKTL